MYGTKAEDEDKYGISFEGVIPNLGAAMAEHDERIRQGETAQLLIGAGLPDLQWCEIAPRSDGGYGRG